MSNFELFQIDLNKKNLLIIKWEDQDIPPPDALLEIENRIMKWMNDDTMPIFILGIVEGVEVRLEKIGAENE